MSQIERLLGLAPAVGPISYKVPLFDYGQRLPTDLLDTGMTWVWQSVGQGAEWPARDPGLPDRKTLTQLTGENAAFTREFVQSDEEYRRWFVAYGGNNGLLNITSNEAGLRMELEAFSESGGSCLAAVLLQAGDSPYEEFVVSRAPSVVLKQLLEVWCERMGTAVDRLDGWPGRTLLRRTLLR